MPPTVIACVYLLGNVESSILTFTNRRGREIGDNPQDFESSGDDDNSVVEHLTDEFPVGVPAPEDDAVLPGVDTDFDVKPTGVEVNSDYAPQESAEVNGLRQQDTKPGTH
jgi:hypothetical protein